MSITDSSEPVNDVPVNDGRVVESVGGPVDGPPELPAVVAALRDLAGATVSARPAPLGGGFWAEMWTLDLSDTEAALPARVVLRLAPNATLAIKETTVQRAVADQGFPTPRILVAGPATPNSRPWSVMELATGKPLLSGLSGLGAIARLPHLARALPMQLGTAAAQLHALDPAPIIDALAAAGSTWGIRGWLDDLGARVETLGATTLAGPVDHLMRTQPSPGSEVVCHGDLHPFNVLIDGGRLTVLDWTATQIAHPEYDLAFTALLVSRPPLAVPAPLRPVINAAARWLATRFTTSYTRLTDRRLDAARLEWYHRLHVLRILVESAEWEASGALDQHAGHPWITMRHALEAEVRAEARAPGSGHP